MRAAKQKQMLLLLFLFLCTLALSITALVLALLVGPLHNNPSSFILQSNSSAYNQQKYLRTQHRLFFASNIGLGFSLLSTIIGCICVTVEYRKEQTLRSSARGLDPQFLERIYICGSCGTLGSIVGAGLQLSILLQTQEQKSLGKWLSMSLAALNQLFDIVIVIYILFSRPYAQAQQELDSPLTLLQKVAETQKPFICQKRANNKPIDFNISSSCHRVKQTVPVQKQKMYIRSTKPRRQKHQNVPQIANESHKTPLIGGENEGDEPQREESQGSDPPNYAPNVENVSNQSQKWKDKVPKLQIELINKQHDLPPLNQLEISEIKPRREVKTSTAQNDIVLKENSPFFIRSHQLNQSKSILSHIHMGKIPSEVQKHQKLDSRKQQYRLRQSNQQQGIRKKADELNPTWQRHSISFDSD